MHALVAERQTEYDVAAEVVRQLVVACHQILGGVAADGYAGGVERVRARAALIARCELLAVAVGVALEVGGALSVGH